MTEPDSGNPIIRPASFSRPEPTGKKRFAINPGRSAIAVLLVAFIIIALFMFNARAVRFATLPENAEVTLSGGLPAWRLGERHLIQQGSYQVRVTSPGYGALETPVTIGPEAEQEFTYVLEPLPGILSITTLPEDGAEVFVDQVKRGETPLTIGEVPAGLREVSVTHPRFLPYRTELMIKGMGKEQSAEFTLEPAWARVTFSSLPADATIEVDGVTVGTTPATVEIVQGSHEVRLGKPGYKTWQSELLVQAQADRVLPEVVLARPDGKLLVTSSPAGANVTLSGRYYGQTPLSIAVPPGNNHELSITRAGYHPLARTISITPEEDRSLDLTLKAILGTVRIATHPPGARLIIDGEIRGEANQTVELPARKHAIRIELPGYMAFETEVTPQADLSQQLNVLLQTEEEARAARVPQQIVTHTGDTLRLVIPGHLKMGAPRREPGRRSNEIEKEVVLTRPYYLGEQEISNRSFKQFSPGHDSGLFGRALLNEDDRPVVNISWEQAVLFCNWLSQQDGLPTAYERKDGRLQLVETVTTGYRLPTEAEWAWAARYAAGDTPTRFPWGNQMPPPPGAGNYADVSTANMVPSHIPGYNDNFRGPSPGGTYAPNELGIFDLGGNVSEWIHDRYSVEPVSEPLTDPLGPDAGAYHVIRGSNYTHGRFGKLRWTFRDYGAAGRPDVGLRIARYLE